MSEPKVAFELNNIEDQNTREMFDQFRRWYEFREDIKTPTMQTFRGDLSNSEEINLYVPGEVYGYSGFTKFLDTFWLPMEFSLAVVSQRCYFFADNTNQTNNYVTIKCNATSGTRPYRVTVFYRGDG